MTVGPAPGWMQRRLTYAGMRPINNIVDITNYVMLEWGQPLHAFDHDVLVRRAGGKAPTITVRPATAGEVLKTLDGVDRKLTPDMLVIADTAGPIALAGVMGGAETEVSARTSNVLLESASFDFLNIRRTMRALELPSEASLRFSRGVHPALVPLALGRASELMRRHAGGTVAQGVVDVYPAPLAPQVVDLPMAEVRRVLGMDIPIADCERIFRTLEFQVDRVGTDALRAVVPPYRLDVQEGPADLIEDLVRLYGYDRLPATRLREELPDALGNDAVAFEEQVRDVLVARGMQEVITYALTTPEREVPLVGAGAEYVRLLNPISSERAAMRRSVLASVLEVAANNLRQGCDVSLFEVGTAYLPRPGEKLPAEPRRLAVVMSGKRYEEFWGDAGATPKTALDFFDLKGVIEGLLADLHLTGVVFRPATAAAMLHRANRPRRSPATGCWACSASCTRRRQPRSTWPAAPSSPPRSTWRRCGRRFRRRTPIGRCRVSPPRLRDVAVIVPEELAAERVEAEIRTAGGPLLRDVRCSTCTAATAFRPAPRVWPCALGYQADDRTLTDKEVEKAHKGVENRLRHVLKAKIRGQDS
ncbi:MAG: phenylalanine--tRNA ligase subunit beta [Gemmataceae bacterium]